MVLSIPKIDSFDLCEGYNYGKQGRKSYDFSHMSWEYFLKFKSETL